MHLDLSVRWEVELELKALGRAWNCRLEGEGLTSAHGLVSISTCSVTTGNKAHSLAQGRGLHVENQSSAPD